MEILGKRKRFIIGVSITLIVALLSMLITQLPVLESLGTLAVAILLSVIYRQLFGYPEAFKQGLEFSAKHLLKLSIILYGLKLDIHIISEEGWPLLLFSTFVIIFSVSIMVLFNTLLKGDKNISLLLGLGTGICGAAAIAATSSIMNFKEKDTAISIGIISLIGTFFAVAYTFVFNGFNISPMSYSVWSGESLHEVANVALAGFAAGEAGLSMAVLTKLTRVLLLIPVCFLLILIMTKRNSSNHNKRIPIPYFLFGFIIMSIFNTILNIPEALLNNIDHLTTLLLAMAMVGLGLNVSFQDILKKALKPFIAVILTSILLSIITLYIAVTFW